MNLQRLFAPILLAAGLAWAGATPAADRAVAKTDAKSIERGRYVAKIAGCNACHTPGYAVSGGNVQESAWLLGDGLGWRGAWGTTYARNLRRYMSFLTEDEWVDVAHTVPFRPPMPTSTLRDMTEADLRALYRFVRQLGPSGEQGPEYVPPHRDPKGPVVEFPAPST